MSARIKPKLLDASALVSVKDNMRDTIWGTRGARVIARIETYCLDRGTTFVLPQRKTLLPQKAPDTTMKLCLPQTTGKYISKIDVKVDPALHEFLQLIVNGICFSPTDGGVFEFPSQSNTSMECTQGGGLVYSMVDDAMQIIIANKPAGHLVGKRAIDVIVTSHMARDNLNHSHERRETCTVFPGAYTIPFNSPVNYMGLQCTGAVPGDELLVIHESSVVARMVCSNQRVVITFTDRHLPQENKCKMNVHTDCLGLNSVNFSTLSNFMLWTSSPECRIGEIDYTCL
jgi:hypothetical protein